MFSSALVLFLAAAASTLAPGADAAPNGTVGGGGAPSSPPASSSGSASVFLTGGELGVVPPRTLNLIEEDPAAVKRAAGRTLKEILETHFGYTGEETIKPITSQVIGVDKQNNVHVRFKQHVEGLPIEGASLALHFSGRTGEVLAMNGEVHRFDSILNSTADTEDMDCDAAMELALLEYKTELSEAGRVAVDGEWLGECQLAAVQGRDGRAYMAYKKLWGHQPPPRPVEQVPEAPSANTTVAETEPYQMDLVFAERPTGRFVAVHPKVFGGRTMVTYDCNQVEVDLISQCDVVSTSPNKISSGDPTVDLAHNNIVDIYDFYLQKFGRRSMDGNDIKIQTLTHYGFGLNNAFFTSEQGGVLAFGDGDQIFYRNWAQMDVVAHEFAHGITHFTSGLIYESESGALNEAFSDVMGAFADHVVLGKSPTQVFQIAEDVDILFGLGIRSMADPTLFYDPDHFAGRYTGTADQGGVHTNSGIMNKAFYLMVQGGTHPTTGITVPAMSSNFDSSIGQVATIFFNANTMCLTESSDYIAMRECSLLFASATQKPTVQKAWDAVGVKAVQTLTAGVTRSGVTLPYNHDVQVFVLDQTLQPGQSVTCSLSGASGDPDLSVRFGKPPSLYPNFSVNNDCWSASFGTTEECTTGFNELPNTKVYVAVEAFRASSNLQLLCMINGNAPPTKPPTKAPARPPTKAPARPPTQAPARPPTKAPASPPVKPPSGAPPPTCRRRRSFCSRNVQCCSRRCRSRRCR